jgi:methionyl-tRNA formyltransferase
MDNRAAGRVPLVLVTGHTFGVRAFEGIFSSRAFLDGKVGVPLMIGLDDSHEAGTVGYASLGRLAAEQGVPYVSTSDGRLSSLAGRIREARPAYILVIGWSHLVGEDILSIPAPACGCIGMHPTMLPTGRGQAPIPWTIIKGGDKTALSVFFLVAEADAGPLIAQYELDIRDGETSASLFYRIAHTHFTAGLELAERLGDGSVRARAQDETTATRWPRRRPEDGEILATMTCREISLLVRALLGPYPRAFIWQPGQSGRGREKTQIRGVEPVADGKGDGKGDAGDGRRIRFRCRDGEVYLLRDSAPAATSRSARTAASTRPWPAPSSPPGRGD